MKLKKLTQKELEALTAVLDNEGFWYCLTGGGYINPHDILEDPKDAERVDRAIETLLEFEEALPAEDLEGTEDGD